MNILQLHGTATKFGGASNGTKILCKEHSDVGHNVILIYNYNNQVLNDFYFINKIPINFSTFNVLLFLKNLLKISRIIKKEKIEVIHSHHRNDTIYAALLKILNSSLSIVYTVHGAQVVNGEKRLRYRILRFLYFKFINRYIDKIIYISKYTQDFTSKYFHSVKEHIVVHNGTPFPPISVMESKIFKNKKNINNHFLISLIGNVGGVKRPELILELANNLKNYNDIKFLIIGDGEQKTELVKNVNIRKLTNVLFFEPTPFIGSYIESSNIIISLALEEGFGRTIIEAMSLRKPVIAFDSGGPKEIIKDNVNGFLIPVDDLDLFSKKILILYKNPSLAAKMGGFGFEIYKENFSEKVYSKRYLEEFELLIN
jgi:glycosyltransferase involved in cell wall biosynthesis